MPLSDAIAICRQIIDALDAAHEKGIVHRDLKPANIKLRQDGAVKVLDFGLAKALESDVIAAACADFADDDEPGADSMGVMLGTAAYMSPEQARGQRVDKRTDIWAFGCVLYEMLSGRCVCAATVAGYDRGHSRARARLVRVASGDTVSMRRLLRRCLDKNRNQRLRDIADARHALDDIEDDASPARHR